MKKIIVYSVPNCPKCEMIKNKLKQNDMKFDEINLSENKNEMKYILSKGFLSAPVICINDTFMDFIKANKWIKEREGK